MLAIIRWRIFVSQFAIQTLKINIHRTTILPAFCMGVKLGCSQ